jgi:F0F1-type ATP synthase assembly protein I
MVIFWLKYLLSVVSIVSPWLLNVPWFFLGVSFCLGALSGIFVARVFVMYRLWC